MLLYRVYIGPQSLEDQERGLPNKQLSRVEKLDTIAKQLSLLDIDDPRYKVLDDELHLAEQSKAIEEAARSIREEREQLAQDRKRFEQENQQLLASFPEKIFVCEDIKSVELWRHMLQEAGIEDVAIMPSDGCCNNQVETWASMQKSQKPDYSPTIFREIDLDGMLNEQVEALRGVIKNKFSRNFKYTIESLPVYEIENFALLSDEKRKQLPSEYYDIEQKRLRKIDRFFEKTARSRINTALKLTDDETIFPPLLATTKAEKKIDEMLQTATTDFLRLMPGKELSKLIPNFVATDFLMSLHFADFPDELKEYLQKVKVFFNEER